MKAEKIDWGKPVQEIEQQIKKLQPEPGVFTFWKRAGQKALKINILKTRVYKFINHEKYTPGKTLVAPQNELCVQCKKNFLIIEELQLEGKKPMKSEEFIRSYPEFIGTILE